MATNSSAPATADIGRLSIDDLLSPLPERLRLDGPGPFVINLTSSTTGIGLPSLNLAGCEAAHAYEIQRSEDGRTRYRLRLGPFETEEAADLILSMVREIYPSALTATAGPEDLRVIAGIRVKAAAAAAAADTRRPPAQSPTTVATNPPVATANFVEPPVITERVQWTPAKPPAAAPGAAARPAPSYVAPAAPDLPKQPASIWDPLPVASRSVAQNFNSAAAKPSMSVSAPLVRRAAAPPVNSTPAKPPMQPAAAARAQQPAPGPSAPTMHALPAVVLKDQSGLPWFVIELATASEAFDPDTVPNLDIFAEYRLYSVAEAAGGGTVHALRVGFFSEEIAAKAVASYLTQYYNKPTIKRVSLAERERLAEQAMEARKDVGATGRHAVIEITDDLVARRKRLGAQAGAATP